MSRLPWSAGRRRVLRSAQRPSRPGRSPGKASFTLTALASMPARHRSSTCWTPPSSSVAEVSPSYCSDTERLSFEQLGRGVDFEHLQCSGGDGLRDAALGFFLREVADDLALCRADLEVQSQRRARRMAETIANATRPQVNISTVIQTSLERLREESKLVVYTADQGWLGGQNGFWGMADHTRPTTAGSG